MARSRSLILAGIVLVAAGSGTAGRLFAQHVIRNDMTGGYCEPGGFGAWSPTQRTCTLATHVQGTLEIVGDGITIDGAGHLLEPRAGDRQGVTVSGRETQIKTSRSRAFRSASRSSAGPAIA
jgi:hypothetical protein